jgi:hypothetical protein
VARHREHDQRATDDERCEHAVTTPTREVSRSASLAERYPLADWPIELFVRDKSKVRFAREFREP